MANPVQVLLLEDNSADAELIGRALTTAGIEATLQRVDSEIDFRNLLASSRFDVILSDNRLPGFDGISALKLARQLAPGVPFIFVSGSLGEERAVQALHEGATDFVLKDRMGRLPSAITRALTEQREASLKRAAVESANQMLQRLEYAARATSDVIWDWHFSSNRVWIGARLQELLNREPESERERPVTTWWCPAIHPDDIPRVTSSLAGAISRRDEQWNADYRLVRKDGTVVDVADKAHLVFDANGQPLRIVGALQDLTMRKSADARFHDLLEAAPDGIVIVDANRKIILVNTQLERLFRFSRVELLGKAIEILVPERLRKASTAEFLAAVELRRVGVVMEVAGRRRDGSEFPAEISLSPLNANGARAVIAAIRDVTERKRFEERIEQERRISALGRLAATIAHEMNNVLMGISAVAEAMRRASKDERQSNSATMILDAVGRGRRVTEEILRFTRPAEAILQLVDLRHWLTAVEPELRAIAGNQVEINVSFPAEPAWAMIDGTRLQQVMTNLVVNARDAMGGSGTIAIALTFDDRAFDDSAGRPPRAGIRLSVKDNGPGIPVDTLPKIFEPLFTTKRNGTGLGLSVVHQIVRSHGGSITAENDADRGAIFTIVLPRVDGTAGETNSAK